MSFDVLPLGEVLSEKGYIRGPFGSALKRQELKQSGIPVYEQQQAIDGHRRFRFFVDQEKYEELRRFIVKSNDLIISCSGTVGRVSVIAEGDPIGIISQALLILRPNIEKLLPRFLYYFLTSPAGQASLLAASHGAVQQNIAPRAVVEKILTPMPSIEDQRAIISVLGLLDDRISLLRETNATLEAIAQALFKSWFVDFDPVRAKMEGRVPEGMDEATAALFPDSFEETELGEVPRGWKQCSVDDVALLKGGKQLEKEHFKVDGLYPVFGGAGVMGRSDSFNAEGFVIMVGRVGAYCGQYFWTQGKAWVNNNASLVTAKTTSHSVWLLHWLMSVDMNVIKKGAAQPFVSNGDIAALKMALPPDDLIAQFVEICAPIFLRLSGLTSQAQTLTDLRDSLLPRLISGQLCLPELLETEVA